MDDVYAPARAQVRPTATHVALFLATVATTLWMGFWFSPLAPLGPTLGRVVEGGAPFAASLVAILFSHEMGHYVLARRHGVDTTLPYFIPVPFGAGTLGAVIRIRSPIPTRRAALEIGAAGPWAGFLVALPLFVWGVAHSEVRIEDAAAAVHVFARSPWEALQAYLAGRPAFGDPEGMQLFGDSLVTWATQRLVLGPLPDTAAVLIHPVGLAAWIGLLVTTLNLVPFGQLDGGHVLYALLGGRRARLACELVSLGLLAAGIFVSWSWLFWWLLTRLLVGPRHPPALREEPLTPGRAIFAVASLVLFLVTFVPVPVSF